MDGQAATGAETEPTTCHMLHHHHHHQQQQLAGNSSSSSKRKLTVARTITTKNATAANMYRNVLDARSNLKPKLQTESAESSPTGAGSRSSASSCRIRAPGALSTTLDANVQNKGGVTRFFPECSARVPLKVWSLGVQEAAKSLHLRSRSLRQAFARRP